MRSFIASTAAAIGAAALFARSAVADVDPIVIKGSKFFYKTNGTQFYMRGVAYQQDYSGTNATSSGSTGNGYTDPLDPSGPCERDIPYMQKLNTNVIRVYAVDPTLDHDKCMNALADAGIYVIADLSSPDQGQNINRDSPSWDVQIYSRYTAVIDNLAKYTNTLGFFAGNEVSNALNNTEASAFVKAAVRDSKAYIKSKNYRTIGVGYATNDDASIRENMADYFNCGDQSAAIDFWGYNIYSWCGESSYQTSGYDVRTKEFSTYSVPAFFAEYGCNQPRPRLFTEVDALFSSPMSDVWSGGIVYMYFETFNKYGLVSVDGDTVTPNSDFDNYSSHINSVSPTGVQYSGYTPTNSPAACPTASDWMVKASPLPPMPNADACACKYSSLTCVVTPGEDETSYGELFAQVCGLNKGAACSEIAHNATTGTYGAYGMCNSTQQLAVAFNDYYNAASGTNKASACGFGGAAQTKAASTGASSCPSAIAAATSNVANSAKSGGSGGSGSSGSTSSGAASAFGPSFYSAGLLPAFITGALAVVSAMGILVL